MSAFTSIESATEPVIGEARVLNKITAHHTMIVTVEGGVTSLLVRMQGSHDGVRWTDIGTFQAPQSGMMSNPPTTHLMAHVRARLLTITGTDAVCSVSIASADDA